MRLNAYVMLADPAWLTQSVLSYYAHVQRIVVSYDEDGIGWNGRPIDTAECISRLRAIDTEGKLSWHPGNYHSAEFRGLTGETMQRQIALDAAGNDADWVIQLDTDEIVPSWPAFQAAIAWAEAEGLAACWYPQRWVYTRLSKRWYLEHAHRRVLPKATHPGPLAVKPGVRLLVARQDDSPRVLLGFSDPYPVRPREAVVHLSWVRSVKQMVDKANISGHAGQMDWTPELREWSFATQHPVRFIYRSVSGGKVLHRMRPMRLRPILHDPLVPLSGSAGSSSRPWRTGR